MSFHDPALAEHEVLGLHIAVDDPTAVGVSERRGGVARDRQPLPDRQPPGRDPIAHAAAGHQLHGDEAAPAIALERTEGRDVRMLEGCGGARLALQALERVGVRAELGGYES